MNSSNWEKIKQLYTDYEATLKLLLAYVEAMYEKFPTPILNEIRSFNDHIARCYRDKVDEKFISENILKAKSHLVRAVFDCYKALNLQCHRMCEEFDKDTEFIDLSLINNGKFLNEYRTLRQSAEKTVREAKYKETFDREESFKLFQKAYNKYKQLIDFLFENRSNINWAKRVKRKTTCMQKIKSIVRILMTIFITVLLTKYWDNIINYFRSIF